jgi:tRNA-Thr(GGU) m(6)t(6)A37 methyltransferase TsaA
MSEPNHLIFQPIGFVQSPFKDLEGMPIQPRGAQGVKGKIIVDPTLGEGLLDLDGFSHLVLIYFFHQVEGYKLCLTPFLDSKKHGVFATRAPRRPNPIGLSVVKLVKINHNELEVEDLDILDGTPVLDIKPYIPEIDQTSEVRIGWLEGKLGEMKKKRSDERFLKD